VSRPLRVLHVSPHPDDEVIGAPATLLGLQDAGHEVVNLAVGLGRPEQRARRGAELEAARRSTGFRTIVHEPPLAISAGDDLALAQRTLAATLAELLDGGAYGLVVSPSPHDGHYGHEAVGRAVRDALAARGDSAPAWWMWGIWADLPLPTLYVPFDEDRLARVLDALGAYSGELARNDFAAMVRGRAEMNRVLGAERVFGYGAAARSDGAYAELLTEVVREGGEWLACAPRVPQLASPLADRRLELRFGWWIDATSVADRARAERARLARQPSIRPAPAL
jgi:LmbE family N-acetylglucosaminyl deacetylase